jgi:hypothetical protein
MSPQMVMFIFLVALIFFPFLIVYNRHNQIIPLNALHRHLLGTTLHTSWNIIPVFSGRDHQIDDLTFYTINLPLTVYGDYY